MRFIAALIALCPTAGARTAECTSITYPEDARVNAQLQEYLPRLLGDWRETSSRPAL